MFNNQNDISILSENEGNKSTNDISMFWKAKRNQWGIDGYYVPTNEWAFKTPKTFWAKAKNENIIEKEARKKKELPAPNTYKLNYDWSKNTKGKFLKGKKCSLIDDILKSKKLKLPGPGTYKIPA